MTLLDGSNSHEVVVMRPDEESVAHGLRHHRAGDLDAAERFYRAALDQDPDHAEAWHLLGVVATHRGCYAQALEHIGRALELRPHDPGFQLNQGVAFQGLGQTAEAADAFRQALTAKTDFPEAHNNLANVLHTQGQTNEALHHWQRAIALRPDYAEAQRNLAVVLQDRGELAQALVHAQTAVRLQPTFPPSLLVLGDVLALLGRSEEAVTVYRQALAQTPNPPDVRRRLAHVLRLAGQAEEALSEAREALRQRPDDADAHNEVAAALGTLGRAGEAEAHARQSLRLRPDDPEACHNLAVLLAGRRQFAEAADLFRQVLRHQPDLVPAALGLARALSRQGLLDEAEDALRRALERKPEHAPAQAALGEILAGQGFLDRAQEAFRTALRLDPKLDSAHSSLLMTLALEPKPSPAELFEESRRFGDRFANVTVLPSNPNHDRNPDRPLRVGYISPDLLGHVVIKFFGPVLLHHDRRQVQAFCYADVLSPDAVTDKLRSLAAGWRVISGMSDDQVAGMIQADGIDILVDLAGHTGNRLGVFARRPASVQATWLGYPETTGLAAMQYRLTDAVVAPQEMEAFHVEELARLPDVFCCYLPAADAPTVTAAPCLQRGLVTFGSTHKLAKLNDSVLDVWANLLRAVPGSRLLIYRDCLRGRAEEALHRRWEQRGMGPDRVELRCSDPAGPNHLSIYRDIDILLDVWPWSGHATVCEALWQGVPTVTLVGDRHACRMVASVLQCVGLGHLLAQTPSEFVTKAAGLASDRDALEVLRQGLRAGVQHSPLGAGHGFTRQLEEVYRQWWRRWLAGSSSA